MKASFHTLNISEHSIAHMKRETKVTYLIEPDSSKNLYKSYDIDIDNFKKEAYTKYREVKQQRMQKKQYDSLIKETVINVLEKTTIEDIERLFNNLNKEFGGHKVFHISIHKDEGYFYHKEEALEYRPNADIFYNQKDKQFYLDSKFIKKADMNDFEKRFNYHAHVAYSPFCLKTAKGRMTRKDMKKVQTITAQSLGMERGRYNSPAQRMNHWQLKQQYDIKRKEKKELLDSKKDLEKRENKLNDLAIDIADIIGCEYTSKAIVAKIKDINAINKKLKQDLINSKDSSQDDYLYLKEEINNLKDKARQKELTISDLEEKYNELVDEFNLLVDEYDIIIEENTDLKKDIDELENEYKFNYHEWKANRKSKFDEMKENKRRYSN